MSPAAVRRLAGAALLATALVLVAWKGRGALAAGGPGVALLGAVVLPVILLAAGVLDDRVRAGRIASLVLPFYAAGFLTEAMAAPAGRTWAAAGAFATALAFATVIAWVRRARNS
ncbi:MAG: DUF2069 domain-containing protein [Gammaproteobacteria bacterium]